MENTEKRFAVLIDADNVSPKYISYILDEVANLGVATYKRIYGDWTDSAKRGWKDTILEWSVNPIQQYSYTTGKNATDSAMIIDAMDILYSGNVEGFCLVSSDSDFTKLAQRLREAGMMVLGMGESKTPKPFRTACDTFKILDVISQAEDNSHNSAETEIADKADITSIHEIKKAIFNIMTDNTNQGRPTGMADLGNLLAKRFSEFDVRNYGYSKLSTFLESFDDFEIVKEGTTYYVLDKRVEIPRVEVEREIERILERNHGQVDNLSIINDEVKKAFPAFHAKQYGFSRFSNFIRSFDQFEIRGNTVRLRYHREEAGILEDTEKVNRTFRKRGKGYERNM
ncbi:MAG: NYN domain-containing protein [Lachnospiraceae bacterium]|nr:NYN domain-containing protein [Lachnospiraceae bacterium]